MYIAPSTLNERLVFYLLALASMIAALLIVWDLQQLAKNNNYSSFPWSLTLVGVAHAFVFVGLLRFVHASRLEIFKNTVYCVLFPLWGSMLGACGMLNILPIVLCSLVWGIGLWELLEDRLAIVLFFLIGFIPLVVVFSVSDDYIIDSDWYLRVAVGLWHIPAAVAILVLGFRRRSMLTKISQLDQWESEQAIPAESQSIQ
tara:strand:- start:655 stop:1257 length:603 start_codon:yes stop_codon:yes gene_type:complete